MKPIRLFTLINLPILFAACASALPGQPPEELIRYAHEAELAAEEANEHAKNAQAEFERSELLLEEVRVLLERAESSERRCAELISKIPKRTTKKVYRVRPRRSRPKKVIPKVEEKNPVVVPKYSPSDAPPGAIPPAAMTPSNGMAPANSGAKVNTGGREHAEQKGSSDTKS
jgi:hypothetical protein